MNNRLYKEIEKYQTENTLNVGARFIFDYRPLKGRNGMTKRKYFQKIEPTDPRFESAPYEEKVIFL